MIRTQSCVLGLALALCFAAPGMAQSTGGNDSGNSGSQTTTGVQTGSQQVPTPATGAATAPTGTTMSGTGTAKPNSFPGGVGPTGSTQPDATNPARSQPSGGGSKN